MNLDHLLRITSPSEPAEDREVLGEDEERSARRSSRIPSPRHLRTAGACPSRTRECGGGRTCRAPRRSPGRAASRSASRAVSLPFACCFSNRLPRAGVYRLLAQLRREASCSSWVTGFFSLIAAILGGGPAARSRGAARRREDVHEVSPDAAHPCAGGSWRSGDRGRCGESRGRAGLSQLRLTPKLTRPRLSSTRSERRTNSTPRPTSSASAARGAARSQSRQSASRSGGQSKGARVRSANLRLSAT